MQSWRIVLDFTTTNDEVYPPETWDWYSFLNVGPDEAFSVVEVQEIPHPEAHVEELAQDALDELAEIAQKHNMGY
jgi:hypothetical protein